MRTQLGILEAPLRGSQSRLRTLGDTLVAQPLDAVVPSSLINQYKLRPGMELEVELGKIPNQGNGQNGSGGKRGRNQNKNKRRNQPPPRRDNGQSAPVAKRLLRIEGDEPATFKPAPTFDELTTVDPAPRMKLEYPGCPDACRLIDLFCPIGYGQRGMIVSPPKAGKTTLLQQIAFALQHNHPDVEVQALLVDERPEEVTDFRRNVPCTVLASSNDHTPERHVSLAILAIERAKRRAEAGQDVVILMDSLTRLGRAFNNMPTLPQTGRTLSGGLDAGALAIPKQLFGAARRFEEGGSLTIIATALIDTGSRGDQVIFEEFKGTGNMELILDRKIAERRLYPAIDLAASGTRKEHLLMSPKELETMNALRRRLLNMPPVQQIEQLLKALKRFETNADLVGEAAAPARA